MKRLIMSNSTLERWLQGRYSAAECRDIGAVTRHGAKLSEVFGKLRDRNMASVDGQNGEANFSNASLPHAGESWGRPAETASRFLPA